MSKYVDLLDEDKPLAEQKYVCLSFVSPEYIIKKKDEFMFENFVEQYHFNKTAELITQFSNYISFKYNINSEEIMDEVKEFVKNETEKFHEKVSDDFKSFMDKNEESLELDFSKNMSSKPLLVVLRFVVYSLVNKKLRCAKRCFVR